MKKILFPLVALVCCMSMNAQVMKIMKNGEDTPVQTYKGSDYYVVFEEAEEAPAVTTTGTAKRTGDIDVNWVQLWENGPKFAEYNVGATSATDCGGYYTWGGTYKNGEGIEWDDDHNTGAGVSDLIYTGNNDDITDTATKLWGSNWRMPTSAELEGLVNTTNCTVEWIDGSSKQYNNTTVPGILCTGKGDYASNSVFLPAAGLCDDGSVSDQGFAGLYWSSTPRGGDSAYYLYFISYFQYENYFDRRKGYSVRAVLAE